MTQPLTVAAALAAVVPFAARERWAPVDCRSVLIEAAPGRVTLTTTGSGAFVTASADMEGESTWSACVEARQVAELARKAKGAALRFTSPDDDPAAGVVVGITADYTPPKRFGRVGFHIGAHQCTHLPATMDAAKFPRLAPLEPVALGEIAAAEIAREMKTLAPIMSKDASRLPLCGVLVEPDPEGLKLVACDGFRLAMGKARAAVAGAFSPVIVPRATVEALARLKGEGQAAFEIGADRVAFTFGAVRITAPTIDATFPDYSAFLGGDGPAVRVSSADLAEAIGLVMAVFPRGQKRPAVLVGLRPDGLRFASKGLHDCGWITGETIIDAEPDEGAEISVCIDGRQALGALKAFDRNEVVSLTLTERALTVRSVAQAEREAVLAKLPDGAEAYDLEEAPLPRPELTFTLPERSRIFPPGGRAFVSGHTTYAVSTRLFKRGAPVRREFAFPNPYAAARAWRRHVAEARRRCDVIIAEAHFTRGESDHDPHWPVTWLTNEQVDDIERRTQAIYAAEAVFSETAPDEAPWPRKALTLKDFIRYSATPAQTIASRWATKTMRETAQRYLSKATPPAPARARVPNRWAGVSRLAIIAAA